MGLEENGTAQAEILEYNALYGRMDAALWCLALHCQAPLVEQSRDDPVVEALVHSIWEWWGLQQWVPEPTVAVMAQKVSDLGLSREAFGEGPLKDDAEGYAVTLVRKLVYDTREDVPINAQGRKPRQFSLASKTLHWLLPVEDPGVRLVRLQGT